MAGVFDFSRYDVEDVVVRTVDDEDSGVWVETLVTPAGRKALWNFSRTAFDSAEEAIEWLKART